MKKLNIEILGEEVKLLPIEKKELKGITIGTWVMFEIYRGQFNSETYCFVCPRHEERSTPSQYAWHVNNASKAAGMPAVLITSNTDYNFRMRLIGQGVYFVASSRYAFLPGLIANELVTSAKKKRVEKLSPKAQFILLYWMQNATLGQEVTISTFINKWDFSYISISRALTELKRYGICESRKEVDNSKTYIFRKDKQSTWQEYQALLRNPVVKLAYSDTPIEGNYRVTNITALSHYSRLNPDNYDSIAVLDSDFRNADWKSKTNELEGRYRIEIWCYEPAMFVGKKFVDKLSLVLSLQDDHDARVEGEVERVINEMPW